MGWREAAIALLSPKPPAAEERASYYAPSAPRIESSNIVPWVTGATANQSVAIRSTRDLIASITSELPITVYTGRGKDRREIPAPSNLADPGGDGAGREDWGYRLIDSWLGAGNAFGDIVDIDPRGRMLQCDLISPDQVSASIVDGRPAWTVNGRTVEQPSRFAHWRVNPVAGRLLGLSPIEHHAAVIGVSLATTRFGRSWFSNGMQSDMLLSHEGELDEGLLDIAKRRYMASIGSREPIVLAGKWNGEALQISPEESQFLETAGYSEAQCARIFGPGFAEILGYETGQKMTYGNVVDRRQDLLVLGLSRWFRRYERVLSMFLPKPQWVEVNRDALLEATTVARYGAHNLALSGKWKTINEVRRLENLEDVPWGDEPQPSTVPAIEPAPPTEKEDPEDGTAAGA